MKIHGYTKYLAIILCISFFSCQSGQEGEDNQDGADTSEATEDTTQASNKMEKSETSSSLLLPSPLQVATIFQETGLSYMEGITHNPDKASEYISSTKRLMNLGVYSADLSYCMLNEQSQEASKYLKTIQGLANKVGIAGVFKSEEVFNRFEENLDNRDSALEIMTKIQQNIDNYLNTSDQSTKSMVIFTGAWVEGMYIGFSAVENKDNPALTARLIEQLTLLENVVNKLNNQQGHSKMMKDVIEQLEKLNSDFKSFVAEKRKEKQGDGDISVEYKEIESVANKVKEIRKQIINA